MRHRIESIQVIRAIAFILIFLSHVELVYTGAIGVSLFLVISGFCMTYAYLDKQEKLPTPNIINNVKFTSRKVKKLYPLHIITLLLVALIIFSTLYSHKASRGEIVVQGVFFVANVLLLQSWIPYRDAFYSFNAVSWYLSTAAFSYFLFPWIFRVIQSKNKKKIARYAGITIALMTAIAAIAGIGRDYFAWTDETVKWLVYICPLYRVGDFVLGLIIGYLFLTLKKLWSSAQYTIAEIFLVIIMGIQIVMYNKGVLDATNWTLSLFWLPTSLVCVYLFAINKGIISRLFLRSKLLVWIGNISGEAFLIHQISIKVVEYLTKNKWIVAIIAFILTMIASVIWRWLYNKVSNLLGK